MDKLRGIFALQLLPREFFPSQGPSEWRSVFKNLQAIISLASGETGWIALLLWQAWQVRGEIDECIELEGSHWYCDGEGKKDGKKDRKKNTLIERVECRVREFKILSPWFSCYI